MDYYGLLFLYYLKGLSGKSVLKLFFNIEVGGTEQLLPENTSTPTTTPILADIQYPDGLRTDQYFTYRETPTTISNKARIKTIKGNTLVWNQLARNGNFVDTSVWLKNGASTVFDVSNNVANVETTAMWGGIYQGINAVSGHKYLIAIETKNTSEILIGSNSLGGEKRLSASSSFVKTTYVAQATADYFNFVISSTVASANTINVKNFMLIDLTQIGLDITDPSDFTSIFSLPYYDYNAGTLLSFNGTGIKTVGFNQWDEEWENGAFNNNTGEKIVNANRIRSKNIIRVSPNETYYFKAPNNAQAYYFDGNMNYIGLAYDLLANRTFVVPSNMIYMYFAMATAYGNTYKNDVCVNLSGDENGIYKTHESHTTDLPVSTYFPTGVKSAGNVYDELTPRKAITRIGAVDLGSLDWTYDLSSQVFRSSVIDDIKPSASSSAVGNAICDRYLTVNYPGLSNDKTLCVIWVASIAAKTVYIKDSSYSDPSVFKNAMNGVYLYYELATPTETPITTEDANEALSLLMGKSVSSNNANQLINIITKGE